MDDNRIISRLKSVIKDGHLPCRFTEKYTQLTAERVNCFAHACFNLSNEQIRLCLKQSDADFFKLSGRKIGKEADAEDILMNIICSSGLNVEKTKVKINDCVLKNNQWIVTLFFTKYFGTHPHLMRDFHFLLQEKTNFGRQKMDLRAIFPYIHNIIGMRSHSSGDLNIMALI